MTKDKKIKILQFPVANSKGGITQYVLRNWEFIDKTKFHFDFATMSKSLDFEEQLTKDGSKVFYISCYAEENKEQFVSEFKKILELGQYDIVHLHTKQWKSTLVEQLAKEAGVKRVIVHAHSSGIDTLDEQKRLEEIELHNRVLRTITEGIATDFWACSELAGKFLYGDRIPTSRIEVMNNAIKLSRFAYREDTRKEYRKQLGIRDDEIIIGSVGRFVYPKNQEFLLEVFKEISELRNDFRLVIVGEGELEERFKKFVSLNRLEEKVRFLGYRNDVDSLLQAFDIFCLPSRFEGYPISLIEAHASGVKCIVSDCITSEVQISALISRLPLDKETWVNNILKYEKYDRSIYAEITRSAGFDLKDQILKIEERYADVG